MANEIITTAQEQMIDYTYPITNKKLKKYTEKITKYANAIRTNYYGIAKSLAEIADNKCYESDGFKSAAEYAETVFGLKRAQSYNLIRIGREYTTPELVSNLPHEDGEDYTTTQIIKMLPVGSRDEVIEFIKTEQVTPDMTAAEINKKVKSYIKGDTTEDIGEPLELQDNEITTDAPNAIHLDPRDAIEQIKAIINKCDVQDIAMIMSEVVEYINNIE